MSEQYLEGLNHFWTTLPNFAFMMWTGLQSSMRRVRAEQRGLPKLLIGSFFGAVSWILLHEIAHVHFQHDSHLLPAESIKQEDDADKFAARWVFDQVACERQREFRILAVGLALAWLLLFEPLGGDAHHPPAINRVMHVSSYFNAQPNSVALEIVSHLFKILFFPDKPTQEFLSSQELFDWTISLFRNS